MANGRSAQYARILLELPRRAKPVKKRPCAFRDRPKPSSCSTTPARGRPPPRASIAIRCRRSEEHTSELQSLMRISYAVFCLKKKKQQNHKPTRHSTIYKD